MSNKPSQIMCTKCDAPYSSFSHKRQPVPASGSTFRWKVGTLQLFVVCHEPFLHVAASLPSYHRKEQIGSDWERRIAQWTCDQFNALEEKSTITENDVRIMIKRGQREVPFKQNAKKSGPAA